MAQQITAVETAIFDGASALADCNAFLATKPRSEIIAVVPVYNSGASEMQYHVTYTILL